MAPFLATLISRGSNFDPSVTSDEFNEQWIHPGDVFSVLLILGGDVVARALAQLAGSGLTPVTFSFGMCPSHLTFCLHSNKPMSSGWVAYSISALVSAFGENKLIIQDPDCKCKIIHGKSGYARDNSSWILGRIMRDFEKWTNPATKEKTEKVLEERWKELKKEKPDAKRPTRASLVVTIYQPSTKEPAGLAKRDWIYWSGVVMMVVQLGVASIPCGLFGDWGILMITAAGTGLAIITGLLPQWKKEKWACRPESRDSYVLTRGNGAQHAIVILGNKRGLNLEDLASGQSNIEVTTNTGTRIALFVLSTLWILLLITAAGVKNNTWFLLAVGGLGIVHNVFVAGWKRRPENFGIPLEYVGVYGETKVMETLFAVEKDYPHLGRSMRDEFFPGRLRPDEITRWEEFEKEAEAGKGQ